MAKIHVTAKRDFLESLATTKPIVTLSELVWNGFDADSDRVVEQLGSGIPRILKTYGRDAFEIRKSFVRVVFYYERPFEDSVTSPSQTKTKVETKVEMRVETPQLILRTLTENPTMILVELAEKIKKSLSTVERVSAKLVKEGKLRHVGPRKGGYWQVMEGLQHKGCSPCRAIKCPVRENAGIKNTEVPESVRPPLQAPSCLNYVLSWFSIAYIGIPGVHYLSIF